MCVWDFTIPAEKTNLDSLKDILKEHCKKFVFQLEEGESGYKHYQGRVSLKVKARKGPKLNLTEHWSITSGENKDNDFYVMKSDTRIGGPWSDKDLYIPRQSRNIILKKWQQEIADDANCCLLYTSPSPRDRTRSRMPSSA